MARAQSPLTALPLLIDELVETAAAAPQLLSPTEARPGGFSVTVSAS
jgi:hypothetical protein